VFTTIDVKSELTRELVKRARERQNMRRMLSISTCLVLLVSTLSACGSGSDNSGNSSESMEELVATVCDGLASTVGDGERTEMTYVFAHALLTSTLDLAKEELDSDGYEMFVNEIKNQCGALYVYAL
jgi:hypothetical protein